MKFQLSFSAQSLHSLWATYDATLRSDEVGAKMEDCGVCVMPIIRGKGGIDYGDQK